MGSAFSLESFKMSSSMVCACVTVHLCVRASGYGGGSDKGQRYQRASGYGDVSPCVSMCLCVTLCVSVCLCVCVYL